MIFFIPDITDEKMIADIYEAFIKNAEAQTFYNVTPRRIFKIDYLKNNNPFTAEVGKIEKNIGENVLAILEAENPITKNREYFIITPSYGGLKDLIWRAGNYVTDVQDFD